ncbi:hypothetical protein LZ32DRAFT_13502 [Colletotrichum eremochloae]|nr:hypothetical protein LZ32DRAFT_13502 [Colletotrichum eremochloae]
MRDAEQSLSVARVISLTRSFSLGVCVCVRAWGWQCWSSSVAKHETSLGKNVCPCRHQLILIVLSCLGYRDPPAPALVLLLVRVKGGSDARDEWNVGGWLPPIVCHLPSTSASSRVFDSD